MQLVMLHFVIDKLALSVREAITRCNGTALLCYSSMCVDGSVGNVRNCRALMLTSVRIVGRGNEAVARLTMAFVAAIEEHRKTEGR